MTKIYAYTSQRDIPLWATLERRLIDLINETPDLVMNKYVRPDGSVLWPTTQDFASVDGLDDAYESFHNWPLFYLLGGDDKFLRLSHFEFDAITRQFARYRSTGDTPMVVDEYEEGYDWMHQGEGYELFYLLNLADPADEKNIERSKRFAALFTGENPKVKNYDKDKKMMRCAHIGAAGPANAHFRPEASWGYQEWKQYYGLPFTDVPGCVTVEDMKREEPARAMGKVVAERFGQGDSIVNLSATTMVMNAYLHTGEDKYRAWIDEYTDAWRERTRQNGGFAPDNVGPDGVVGSHLGGRWYGANYGWTWPHGFAFIAEAMTIAGEAQCLLHGDVTRLDWFREQVNKLVALGIEKDGTLYVPYKRGDAGAYQEYYGHINPVTGQSQYLTAPGKRTDREDFVHLFEKDGFFEFMPMRLSQMAHLYSVTRDAGDLALIRRLHNHVTEDAKQVRVFHSKHQGGHDAAWIEYLNGGYDAYPLDTLNYAIGCVYGRVKRMREDDQDPSTYSDAYLQARNPVNCEALIQLTTGGTLPLYNGGLMMTPVRHFDADEKRPGLPKDVAALVTRVDADGLSITLVNASPCQTRSLVMEAGSFGQHSFERARFAEQGGEAQSVDLGGSVFLEVELAPASEITLDIEMKRFVNQPSYRQPW